MRFFFHTRDPFRGAGQRIVAKVHGGGSRVVGLTLEDHLKTALAGNRLHNSQVETEAFEYRALLDVEFDVAERISSSLGVTDSQRIEAKCANGIDDSHAIRVAPLE